MTTDPVQLLSGSRALTRRVRATQRATWFPLLVLAAVTFAAIPVERWHGWLAMTCHPGHAGRSGFCVSYGVARFVYWPAALVLAYAVIAMFYLRRARARGVGPRIAPYVVAGITLAIALTGAALWAVRHVDPRVRSATLVMRLTSPTAAIGAALLVLAWVERSRALAVLAAGYVVVVLTPVASRWAVPWPSSRHLVVGGGVLLLAAAGFALAQRRSG